MAVAMDLCTVVLYHLTMLDYCRSGTWELFCQEMTSSVHGSYGGLRTSLGSNFWNFGIVRDFENCS